MAQKSKATKKSPTSPENVKPAQQRLFEVAEKIVANQAAKGENMASPAEAMTAMPHGIEAWVARLKDVDADKLRDALVKAGVAEEESMESRFDIEMALNKNQCPCPHCSGHCELSEPPEGLDDLMSEFVCDWGNSPSRTVGALLKRARGLYKAKPSFTREERAEIVAAWTEYNRLQEQVDAAVYELIDLLLLIDRTIKPSPLDEHMALPSDAHVRVVDMILACVYSGKFRIDGKTLIARCVDAALGKTNVSPKPASNLIESSRTAATTAVGTSADVQLEARSPADNAMRA